MSSEYRCEHVKENGGIDNKTSLLLWIEEKKGQLFFIMSAHVKLKLQFPPFAKKM